MEGKLHYLFIFTLTRVCCSLYAAFPQQPYPLSFQVAPGIQSFSHPYRSLSRSEGTIFLGGIAFPGSNGSKPLKNSPSSQSAIIMPGHLGNVGSSQYPKVHKPKPTISNFETGSGSGSGDYDSTDFDKIRFPSHNPSGTKGISPSVTRSPGTDTDTDCKIENALLYYGGKCESLLTQGPCSPNQWLIIGEEEVPVCAQRQCQDRELLYKGRCVSINDTTVCGTSEILYVEFSGEVYCDCLPYYVYDKGLRKCTAENDQGSCPFGQFLDIDSNDNLRCIDNPCKRDDLVYNPTNKSCYKKLYKGPCKEEKGYEVIYYEKDQTATCGSVHNRNIFEVPALTSCPSGSRRDYFGKCQKVLRLNPSSPQAYRVPAQQVSRYSQCPFGLTKYPDGSCRKINDLLGR